MGKTIYDGFLVDKKWEKSLRRLKPKAFYQLFWEIYDYQMSGGRIPIPDYSNNEKLELAVACIKEQIDFRLVGAKNYASSARKRDSTPPTPPPYQAPMVASTEVPTLPPTISPMTTPILPKSKAKTETESISKAEAEAEANVSLPLPISPPLAPSAKKEIFHQANEASIHTADITPQPPQPSQSPQLSQPPQSSQSPQSPQSPQTSSTAPPPPHAQEKNSENDKQRYGVYQNILLTAKEYSQLTLEHGIPTAYIDHFSERMAQNHYPYTNHANAILSWWERDHAKPQWSPSYPISPMSNSPISSPPSTIDSFDDIDWDAVMMEQAQRMSRSP